MQVVLEKVMFHQESSRFTIGRVKIVAHDDAKKIGNTFTCKGCLYPAIAGTKWDMDGKPQFDDKRNEWQLIIDKACLVKESEFAGMVEYLVREGPNLGDDRAERLVKAYGSDVLRMMEQEPERLVRDIPGLTEKRAAELSAWAKEDRNTADLKVQLYGWGCTHSQVMRILGQYGSQAASIVKANPFQLAEEVDGIGFKMASKIAEGLGIRGADPRRVRAGILHVLQSLLDKDGHTCIPQDILVREVTLVLEVPKNAVIEQVKILMAEGHLLTQHDDPKLFSQFPELFEK